MPLSREIQRKPSAFTSIYITETGQIKFVYLTKMAIKQKDNRRKIKTFLKIERDPQGIANNY
ncbi:unknown [Bacteroides sp. CAG:144]|nr:unknown [Bacteroides sp. CAG:144]